MQSVLHAQGCYRRDVYKRQNMDRARYHALREKLKEYEGVDLTPYQERLESQKNLAEQQEIKNMIRQSRKITLI